MQKAHPPLRLCPRIKRQSGDVIGQTCVNSPYADSIKKKEKKERKELVTYPPGASRRKTAIYGPTEL